MTRHGKPVSVIIPIKDYEEMIERLEDAEDVRYLKSIPTRKRQYRALNEYLAARAKR